MKIGTERANVFKTGFKYQVLHMMIQALLSTATQSRSLSETRLAVQVAETV